jgi:hypothetical protein
VLDLLVERRRMPRKWMGWSGLMGIFTLAT